MPFTLGPQNLDFSFNREIKIPWNAILLKRLRNFHANEANVGNAKILEKWQYEPTSYEGLFIFLISYTDKKPCVGDWVRTSSRRYSINFLWRQLKSIYCINSHSLAFYTYNGHRMTNTRQRQWYIFGKPSLKGKFQATCHPYTPTSIPGFLGFPISAYQKAKKPWDRGCPIPSNFFYSTT